MMRRLRLAAAGEPFRHTVRHAAIFRMKSNKQKRSEIKAKRVERRLSNEIVAQKAKLKKVSPSERVNAAALAPNNSYSVPLYVQRGYYVDEQFTCEECGTKEVWKASQQKWWFEVAKGYADSRAVRCAACRRKKRAHREKSLRGARQKRLKKKEVKT